MANVFRSLRRAERKAASLPTGYRINLALYALVVLGIGLIALDVKGGSPSPIREVQTSPQRPLTETTRPPTTATPQPPEVLGPGDLTPTPPPAVTPGGVVIGQPGPSPSAPPPTVEPEETSTPTETVTPPVTPILTATPEPTTPFIPTPATRANRAAALIDEPGPELAPRAGLNLPDPVRVTPPSIPPLHIPPPASPRLP